MAFLGLKVLAAVAQGVKKIAGKIKAKKEAKIQKKVDSAVARQNSLQSIFGEAGVSIPAGGSLKNAADNLLGIKPSVSEGEGTTVGGNKDLPSWLMPVAIAAGALLLLPKLLGRKRR